MSSSLQRSRVLHCREAWQQSGKVAGEESHVLTSSTARMKRTKQAGSRKSCRLSVLTSQGQTFPNKGALLNLSIQQHPPRTHVQISEPGGDSLIDIIIVSQAAQRWECESQETRFGSQFCQSLNVWPYAKYFSVSQFLLSHHFLKG